MGLYLLKQGSFSTGSVGEAGKPYRKYNAKDINNNIVEWDEDLVKMDSAKFAYYEGPAPDKQTGLRPGAQMQDPPPGPPSDQDRAAAMMTKAQTVADARKQAEWHRQQADSLEQQATESERAFAEVQQREQTTKTTQPPPKPAAQYEEEEEDSNIPDDQELSRMTKEDLVALAEMEEVDVKSSATKPEIIQALKQARGK